MTGRVVSLRAVLDVRGDAALALYAIDPRRHHAARLLARILQETGARSGRILWMDQGAPDWGYPAISIGRGWGEPSMQSHADGQAGVIDLAMGKDSNRRLWIMRLRTDGTIRLDRAPALAHFAFSIYCSLGRFGPTLELRSTPGQDSVGLLIDVLGEWVDYGWEVRSSVGSAVTRRVAQEAARCEDQAVRELIVSAVEALGRYDIAATGRTLTELGAHLEDRGDLERAAVIQRLAYEAAIAAADGTLGARSARLRGRALRKLGQWREAERWYRQCVNLAGHGGGLEDLAIAHVGLANIATDEGAFPRAREAYMAALGLAVASRSSQAEAMARQGLSYLDAAAGRLRDAALGVLEAASLYPSDADRGNALVQLGGILIDLGALRAAESAFTVALEFLEDADTRALAAHGMTHLAARRGDELGFRRMRCAIDSEIRAAGPRVRVQALFFDARSFAALGRTMEARGTYEAALALAREFGMHQYAERSFSELEALN